MTDSGVTKRRFDPHADTQQRCPRCGRFMAKRQERYEAGDADVWHECMRVECQKAEADAINAYWSQFDVDAFRTALEAS